jgi:hypothetical protein
VNALEKHVGNSDDTTSKVQSEVLDYAERICRIKRFIQGGLIQVRRYWATQIWKS